MYEKPTLMHTFSFATATEPYLAVKASGTDDVAEVAGDNEIVLGFTQDRTKAANQEAPVILEGIAQVKLGSGGGDQGDRMKAASGGVVVKIASAGTTIQQICCILLAGGIEDDVVPALVVHSSERPALSA